MSYFSKISRNNFLWTSKGPLLTQLDFEITERCNNRCLHCCINLPSDDRRAKDRELSTSEIQGIIKEAAELGTLSLRVTGGEPLLREDFAEIYTYARKQGLKVRLFTNARLITPRISELLSKIPPLELMEVTIYGMSEASYEAATRAEGSFAQCQRGVELLLKHNIPFIVKGALLPPNSHEIEGFDAWCRRIPWMKKQPSYALFFNLRDRRDSSVKNQAIQKLRLSPEAGVAFLKRRSPSYLKEMRQFCNKFIGPQGDLLFSCGAGYRPCIDAYGNIQLCLSLRHPDTVFSLKNGSLREAITSFFPKVREIRATNSAYLTRCARCFLKGLCEQCPAKSWSEHGTLDTPVEYFCTLAHAQARDLGLLEGDEKGWEIVAWRERVAKLETLITTN